MFTLIKMGMAAHEANMADIARKKELIEEQRKNLTPEQQAELKRKDDEGIDMLFECIGIFFKILFGLLTFGVLFYICREIRYQNYAYIRTRYREENL